MRTVAIVMAFSMALAAAGFVTACDKTPTPTPMAPSPGPAAGPAPVITTAEVEMVGPEIVPLGETIQFRLMARLTDGSSADVTHEARWSWGSTERVSPELVSISSPGLVKGLNGGEAWVSAEFDGRRGVRLVMVLPAGTYRLTGTVVEADAHAGRVIGARIDVTTGIGSGVTAITNSAGIYRLYGVTNGAGLRVTKDGYQPVTLTATVADHHAVQDVALPLLAPRVTVSGIYTLTIAAADQCGLGLGDGQVPEEARLRTYGATVRQEGPQLWVTLIPASGAPMAAGHQGFRGRAEPGGASFYLRWDDGYEPEVAEQLTTSRFLIVDGTVTATGSANRLAGTLSGTFWIRDGEHYYSNDPIARCSSESHQFVLSR
jgi:hypothetical protein